MNQLPSLADMTSMMGLSISSLTTPPTICSLGLLTASALFSQRSRDHRETNTSEIRAVAADGSRPSELLLRPDQPVSGFFWPQRSPDGRYLLFVKASGPSGASIWAMPTLGDKTPVLVVQPQNSQANIVHMCPSHDGRWLAYSSTDSGRLEVYVTRFPSGSGRWQVARCRRPSCVACGQS